MFPREKAGEGAGGQPEEEGKPGGLPPDNNKDGNRGFQRRSGCTQHRALAWLNLPARTRLVPLGHYGHQRKAEGPALGLGLAARGRKPAAGSS